MPFQAIFDFFVFAMVCVNALSRPRDGRTFFMKVMHRDGTCFFLVSLHLFILLLRTVLMCLPFTIRQSAVGQDSRAFRCVLT